MTKFLIFFLLFVFIFSLTIFVFLQFYDANLIRNRLNNITNDLSYDLIPISTRTELKARNIFTALIHLSMPDVQWESSSIRTVFLTAGFYRELDALIFYLIKTIFTFFIPIVFSLLFLLINKNISFISVISVAFLLSAFGYYLPDFWLSQVSKNRKRDIFESLPNAIDLMRICINAGLGLDAAIERVGKELQINSTALAQEFRILSLELRTGATRHRALTNLAIRTGVEDIHALISMLIQTEKFGTSISEALRVYSDGLRVKRVLLAQEQSAKIPVKMTFPLILCIFPSIMMVLIGPAIIAIARALTPIFINFR